MSKIGVGVGEDFPVDEGKPSEQDAGEAGSDDRCSRHRGSREEHRRRHAEWHDRAHRIRDRLHERFGDHPFAEHNGLMLRVLVGAALFGLAIALLPHVFLIVALALAVVFFAAHRGGFYHHHHAYRDTDA